MASLLGALAIAPAAQAQGGTAPSYPGNTLKLEATGPVIAGFPVRVHMSGRADWGEPTDVATVPYSLYIYAQDADVDPACERSYGAQLGKSINIPNLGASETLTDFVLSGELQVNPSLPAQSIDWQGDSLPFVISRGVSRVLLCGYVRYVIDDVAWYQLALPVRQWACGLPTKSVRQGRRLTVACPGLFGRLRVRLVRGRSKRTISAPLAKDGTAKLGTRGLRPGVYRVTVLNVRGVALSPAMRLRVR
jgi:hypothetical protein